MKVEPHAHPGRQGVFAFGVYPDGWEQAVSVDIVQTRTGRYYARKSIVDGDGPVSVLTTAAIDPAFLFGENGELKEHWWALPFRWGGKGSAAVWAAHHLTWIAEAVCCDREKDETEACLKNDDGSSFVYWPITVVAE